MFDVVQFEFKEEIDALDYDSDPLSLLLAAEEAGEFVFHLEVPADRELH